MMVDFAKVSSISTTSRIIEITFKEINKLKKELYDILANHTGKPYKTIEKDGDRDFWMTAEEAKEYGMIDEVLGLRKKK